MLSLFIILCILCFEDFLTIHKDKKSSGWKLGRKKLTRRNKTSICCYSDNNNQK